MMSPIEKVSREIFHFESMHKNLRLVFTIGILLAVIPLPLLAVMDHSFAIAWFIYLMLLTTFAVYQRAIGQELIVALLFALFVTSYHQYMYEDVNVFIGEINLYPLIAWTGGLVLLREIYERFKIKHRWVLTSGLYLILLFTLEYVGYYVLGIHLNGDLPSFLGTGIIHGTPFIHVFYLLAGPIYLLVTDYLKVR